MLLRSLDIGAIRGRENIALEWNVCPSVLPFVWNMHDAPAFDNLQGFFWNGLLQRSVLDGTISQRILRRIDYRLFILLNVRINVINGTAGTVSIAILAQGSREDAKITRNFASAQSFAPAMQILIISSLNYRTPRLASEASISKLHVRAIPVFKNPKRSFS